MADQHHRDALTGKLMEDGAELFLAPRVHARRGFVEQQHLRLAHQGERQEQASLLAAGHVDDARLDVAGHADAADQFIGAGKQIASARPKKRPATVAALPHDLQAAQGIVRLQRHLLGHVADARRGAVPSLPTDVARRGMEQPHQQPEKRRLPAAIGADDAEELPRVERERDVPEDRASAQVERDLLHLEHVGGHGGHHSFWPSTRLKVSRLARCRSR